MSNLSDIPFEILFAGIVIVIAIPIKRFLPRFRMPPLVGYLLLGFLLRVVASRLDILSEAFHVVFEFLANVGLIVLLFRVGLESKIGGLKRELHRAAPVWTGDVIASGLVGYLVSHYLLGLTVPQSLCIGTALTATSVGVSVVVWQEARAVTSPNGELLIDVAELDDISGVVLMALLFSLVPLFQETASLPSLGSVSKTGAALLFKLFLFGNACILFALFVERRWTGFFSRLMPASDPMLPVAGTGFIIAAVAGLIGFSIAIGSFFAGLIFSRDPRSIKIDRSFGTIYELFVPFFFIGIGLQIDPSTIMAALPIGVVLYLTALTGKVIGAGGFTWAFSDWKSGMLIGASMVPRAEIAMVIIKKGSLLGDLAVPPRIYSAMVVVAMLTCVSAPVAVQSMLKRWPQGKE